MTKRPKDESTSDRSEPVAEVDLRSDPSATAEPSATDKLLDADIARELLTHGTLIPPWAKYPNIPRRSIGWRMGGGEWYRWMWHRWWERQTAEVKADYEIEWKSKTPAGFEGFLPF